MSSYWQAFKEYAMETAVDKAFYYVDKDSSGQICVKELQLLVETINGYYDTGVHPTEADMKFLLEKGDVDKNGTLSLAEVKAMFNNVVKC